MAVCLPSYCPVHRGNSAGADKAVPSGASRCCSKDVSWLQGRLRSCSIEMLGTLWSIVFLSALCASQADGIVLQPQQFELFLALLRALPAAPAAFQLAVLQVRQRTTHALV